MNCNYLFVIIILITLVYLSRNTERSDNEKFGQINLKSFNNRAKHTRGYLCNNKSDGLPDWAVKKYNLQSFCRKYPSYEDMQKITTIIVPKATCVQKHSIVKLKPGALKARNVPTSTIRRISVSARLGKTPIADKKELLLTEASEHMKSQPKYKFMAVGKNDKVGEVIFYGGDSNKMNTKEVKDSNYDLYLREGSVEYSLETWLKIDRTDKDVRNIFHHGNDDKTRSPSLYIEPDENKLKLSVLTTTSADQRGEDFIFGGATSIPTGEWCHIVVCVSDKKAKVFINGELEGEREFNGKVIWRGNQTTYISCPWHSSSGFCVSKTRWYPYSLSNDFVATLAYNSFPLDKFDPKKSLMSKRKKSSIALAGSWEEVQSATYKSLSLTDDRGLIFIDGTIRNRTDDLTKPCLFLDSKYYPDRVVKMVVHSKGSHLSNKIGRTERRVTGGKFLVTITPNGAITISDRKITKDANLGEYVRGMPIDLSNIRYSIIRGKPLKMVNGARVTNEGSGHIGYVKTGTTVMLTGQAGNIRNWRWFFRLPPECRNRKFFTRVGTSGTGTGMGLYFTNWGGVYPHNLWSGYQRYGGQNVSKGNNIYLDGITFNVMSGQDIKLHRAYTPWTSWVGGARVTSDNGLITLSGIIIVHRRQAANKSYKYVGCRKDKWRRDITYRNPSVANSRDPQKQCATYAKSRGHNTFSLQYYGYDCWSGNSSGKYGASRNCRTKCKGNKRVTCGGPWANSVYHLTDQRDVIGRLPKAYWPSKNMRFMVNCGWLWAAPISHSTMTITKDGYLHINSKSANTSWVCIDNISYLVGARS